MSFIESLFYMIWRGIAIGVLISAPMGPVGILCIQRTLDKGRRTGFYTGVGAAISDLLYCLLTGFGLSFIEEFIERNQNIIQLIGSAVLIGFGIFLFKKNPAQALKKPAIKDSSPKKDILGGFLFTFSNPLILFLIIGLFARFNFLMPDIKFYHYIVGFVSIITGALGWWWLVTYFIDKVRAHFNLRSMWLINRITGGVIFLFAIVGIVTSLSNIASAATPNRHWNKGRSYEPFQNAGSDGIHLANTSDTLLIDSVTVAPATDYAVTFRVDNLHGHPSRRYQYKDGTNNTRQRRRPPWAFFIEDSQGTHCWVTINKNETADDAVSSSSTTNVSVSQDDSEHPLAEKFVKERELPFAGETLWRIEISSGNMQIIAGDRELVSIIELPVNLTAIHSFGFAVAPGGEIMVSDISYLPAEGITEDPGNHYQALKEEELFQLKQRLDDSEDPLEGIWVIFDRTLDESLLRLGGDYKLAIVKNHDRYDIIYLEGARVNGNIWKPGMIKGHLLPTPFSGLYNLRWKDSEGKVLSNSITAQSGEGNTLLLQFPYHSSTIRLRRID